MKLLLVAVLVVALVLVAAGALVLGLALRAARADKVGRERSDLAGAPERMQQRDLPELDTRRISKERL